MAKKTTGPSQLMELFLTVASELGFKTDKELATLADVGPENVSNWRTGAVKEFKTQKFRAAVSNLSAHVHALRTLAGLSESGGSQQTTALEIEEGSAPTDLHRQFRSRVVYDYLGHRFLYVEPQGALAWENLIRAGYEQDTWLSGVGDCADKWLDTKRDGQGQAKGPIARAFGMSRRDRPRGVDIISLGPGEGGKEVLILKQLLAAMTASKQRPNWVTFAPVDVSIALLLKAAQAARAVFEQANDTGRAYRSVLPFCADFEEGPMSFLERLRSSEDGVDDVRLVLILGNVLGNIRDEEAFVRQKMWKVARPGDLVWVEVGLRGDNIEDDPLFRLTQADRRETAAEANRRLLLEGPYRRWASAIGRPNPDLGLRIWVREDDDSARVPGSCNFCHDLVIKDESRVVTMLYSRRYRLDDLAHWFESFDFDVEGLSKVSDSKGRPRVAHLLLRRRG